MNLNCRSNIHLLYTEGTRFGYPLLFMPKKTNLRSQKPIFNATYDNIATSLIINILQHNFLLHEYNTSQHLSIISNLLQQITTNIV